MSTTNIMYNLSSVPDFNELVYNNTSKSNLLNKTLCVTKNNKIYYVIRYDKTVLTFDVAHTYGLFRSVVLNSSNVVVSFAPPKSLPSDIFITMYPNLKNENIVIEEFLEGTMINVFWDPVSGLDGGWEVATRNIVGGDTYFYLSKNAKSFRTMFIEACVECNFSINDLDKRYCYSFVLQHPENRIVIPFKNPELYLVAVYEIMYTNSPIGSKEKPSVYVNSIDMEHVKKNGKWELTKIKFPEKYDCSTYVEIINKYASMNTPYNIVGVVIKNTTTGERCKIRNPVYEQIRQLKGNQPKLQYQYLCLRKEGMVSEYLKYYPESKHEFSVFRDQLHLFTKTLYQNYISCYIKKERELMTFGPEYRTHMFNIHKKYIDELREKKLYITNTEVIKYVNELHPSLLMYSLNSNFRKQNIDFIVADSDTDVNNTSV